MNNKRLLNVVKTIIVGATAMAGLSSCCNCINTPESIAHLAEFHLVNFEPQENILNEGSLDLYVDYSTCNYLGQSSQFFQNIEASLVNKTTTYYSIKGNQIAKEDMAVNGGVYTLLRNIEEVNYAELAKAAEMMSQSDSESVLISDCEYYTQTMAKGHDNDPYFANAFKTWILRGYDVHVISEPYLEPYNGQNYKKKRFYILFTDDRMTNNIYDRICRTIDFTKFPEVDEFHISASHPQMMGNGNNSSTQNSILESKSKGFGTFEIEDWDGCDWKTIEEMLVNAVDENTGEPLKNGAPIIEMGLNKNSFGCYRIKNVSLKVYDINQEYSDFFSAKEANEKIGKKDYGLSELENFMQIDPTEFNKHSKINISFNADWFDPNVLIGNPYNYFKLDVVIDEVQSIFDQHEGQFEFESITRPGEKNVSVASSIKQCLADDKVLDKMKDQVIYSIYVKSEKK